MITYRVEIDVDQFADDDIYSLFESRLACIGDQIYAEPVVDHVKVVKETVIDDA